MKRLWIGVTVLIVLLAVGIFLTEGFSSIHTPLAETLSQAADSAQRGDIAAAAEAVANAQKQWEQCRDLSAAVVDHRLLEEMNELFAQLALARDPQQIAALCARLSSRAEDMAESQTITWWNLL